MPVNNIDHEHMTITPMSPVAGAEIRGIDLASGVDDDQFRIIHRAFLDHGVLVFRDQNPIEPDVQVAFGERFGPLHEHPAAPTLADNPAIFVIHTHRDSKVANGNGWHTDVSCDDEPPQATMLQIHAIPESGGGDTLFAHMGAAYDSLSPAMRSFLNDKIALHESEHVYRGRYADRGVDDAGRQYPKSEHPVIRTHPETGRQAIFVNPSFTTRIKGLARNESSAILGMLHAHTASPEFQTRLTWNENDVALWDNRIMMHFAVWDYWPHERKGHRVTIKGDRPFHDATVTTAPSESIRVSRGRQLH